MAESTRTGAVSWEVLTQTPAVDLDKQGRAVQGVTITFTTGKGNTGTVFVPRKDFTAERARAEILAHASELDAVSDSKG